MKNLGWRYYIMQSEKPEEDWEGDAHDNLGQKVDEQIEDILRHGGKVKFLGPPFYLKSGHLAQVILWREAELWEGPKDE